MRTQTSKPYSMLSRQSRMPKPIEIIDRLDWKLIDKYIKPGETYAIDFETNGLDATVSDFVLFGVGIANDDRAFYIDFRSYSPSDVKSLLILLSNCKLLAHNVVFDGACMYRYLGTTPNFIGCTLTLFKMMQPKVG